MYIVLSTCTREKSYSYLRLGEIDDASAKFIHDNLDIAFPSFIFLPVLRDLFADSIDFYGGRLVKFE